MCPWSGVGAETYVLSMGVGPLEIVFCAIIYHYAQIRNLLKNIVLGGENCYQSHGKYVQCLVGLSNGDRLGDPKK